MTNHLLSLKHQPFPEVSLNSFGHRQGGASEMHYQSRDMRVNGKMPAHFSHRILGVDDRIDTLQTSLMSRGHGGQDFGGQVSHPTSLK